MRLAMMEAREVVTSMEVAGPLEEEVGKETKVELGARAMLAIVEVVGPLGAVAGHLKTRRWQRWSSWGRWLRRKEDRRWRLPSNSSISSGHSWTLHTPQEVPFGG